MKTSLTVERLDEAQKLQRAEVSERIAEVRTKHAAKQEGDDETPPESQSD